MHSVLVSVFCPDRPGLVAAIAGRLFELGANLGDASFAVLGTAAEFTAICQLPNPVSLGEMHEALARLPELTDATISVKGFGLDAGPSPTAKITHVVSVGGGDRPGLIARLTEVFSSFQANIVRMDAQTLPDGGNGRYITRFAVMIPPAQVLPCRETIDNAALEMGLSCQWTEEIQYSDPEVSCRFYSLW
jgi:glycine cleavage system transcriptional repressor